MDNELLDRVIARLRRTAHKRHSPAYRWLREHHARLAPVLAELDPPFGEIAAEMNEAGISGGCGKALTFRAVMRIWQRVCRDLVAEGRRPEPKARPSRLPATWWPQEATPPQPPVVVRPATGQAAVVNNEDCTPEEALAGLRRILDERSGR